MSDHVTDAERIQARYPTPRRRGWLLVAVAVTLAAVGLGWLIPTALHHSNPSVTGAVIIFDIDSPTHVSFTLEVRRADPQRRARCTVIAIAENYERVGEVTVPVNASVHPVVEIHHELRTFREATTVEVKDCQLV